MFGIDGFFYSFNAESKPAKPMATATARAFAPPLIFIFASTRLFAQTNVEAGRMAEVFQQTTLSPANVLNGPWEITYGPDGYLWITEAKGYKVYRMNPATGSKTTVLNISQNSTFLPASDQAFNVQFPATQGPGHRAAAQAWPFTPGF